MGTLIHPGLILKAELGGGFWVLLTGVALFFLVQPRGLLLPRKYTQHLRTLLWEEIAGCDLNPPQYNWIRSLIRADRG